MSKWIKGFPPNRSGSYLTCITMTEEVTPFSNVVSKRRLDYDSKLGEWRRLDGYVYYRNTFIYGNHYNFYWWDEFKITEEKIVKKLKF